MSKKTLKKLKTNWFKLKFKVNEETEFKFKKFKHEFSKEQKEATTSGEALAELLTRVRMLESENKALTKENKTLTRNNKKLNRKLKS